MARSPRPQLISPAAASHQKLCLLPVCRPPTDGPKRVRCVWYWSRETGYTEVLRVVSHAHGEASLKVLTSLT
jgi:hypothetical protein